MIALNSASCISETDANDAKVARKLPPGAPPLGEDIEEVVAKKPTKTHHPVRAKPTMTRGGEARHHQTPNHRYAHHFHRRGLIAHGSRTEVGGDGRSGRLLPSASRRPAMRPDGTTTRLLAAPPSMSRRPVRPAG